MLFSMEMSAITENRQAGIRTEKAEQEPFFFVGLMLSLLLLSPYCLGWCGKLPGEWGALGS